MKTLFIGDTHGRDTWKKIIEAESDADKIIFLGDYFDSFDVPGVAQLHNFNEIVEFKKNSDKNSDKNSNKNSDKEIVLLFGNHDFQYMPGFTDTPYSGYQPGMAWQFRDAIQQNLEHLQMTHLHNNVLCSHAGISVEWVEKHFSNTVINDLESVSMLVDSINDHFKFKPNIFNFNGWDPYGNNTYQTPIWIRPDSLFKANKGSQLRELVVQIVGHTQVSNIFDSFKASDKAFGNKYFLIDAIASKGYLVLEDDVFTPKVI